MSGGDAACGLHCTRLGVGHYDECGLRVSAVSTHILQYTIYRANGSGSQVVEGGWWRMEEMGGEAKHADMEPINSRVSVMVEA